MTSRGQQRRGFWLLWAICLTLVLGSHPDWMTAEVRLLPEANTAMLAQEQTWHVPLASWSNADRMWTWPYVLFAAAAAALIVPISLRSSEPTTIADVSAAIGLSLTLRPQQLTCAAVLALIWIARGATPRTRSWLSSSWLIVGCACLGVVSTLEFGIVLAACTVSLIELRRWNAVPNTSRQKAWAPPLLFVAAVLAAGIWLPGFQNAALRPVSWIWIATPAELLPSLQPSWRSLQDFLPFALLTPLWFRQVHDALQSRGLIRVATSARLLLATIGLLSVRYVPLAGFWLAASRLPPVAERLPAHFPRWMLTAALVLACIRAAYVTDYTFALAGSPPQRLIDPARWQTQGPVILLNLDHATEWRTGASGDHHPLVIDDRWDACGDWYRTYADVVADLRDVRDSAYRRTDGEWGGYRHWIETWKPALLVVDSMDTEAIRGLSLSPDWRIMGLDGQRTIFGHVQDPDNRRQMSQAVRCLMTLEWPAGSEDFNLEDVIVATSDRDAQKVADVLCALRFPYAALRYLRGNDSTDAGRVRSWCYLELAHRVMRHSSAQSLLDQHRALVAIQHRAGRGSLPASESARLARSLRGLALDPPANLGRQDRLDASDLTDAVDDLHSVDVLSDLSEAERNLRRALLAGDAETSRRLLDDVAEPHQPFYACLIDAPGLSAVEISSRLQSVIAEFREDVSGERAAEAYFYLGCAAIEAGDSSLARTALEESVSRAPNLQFREIRAMYLSQLTR